jgi:hypothetical protein
MSKRVRRGAAFVLHYCAVNGRLGAKEQEGGTRPPLRASKFRHFLLNSAISCARFLEAVARGSPADGERCGFPAAVVVATS